MSVWKVTFPKVENQPSCHHSEAIDFSQPFLLALGHWPLGCPWVVWNSRPGPSNFKQLPAVDTPKIEEFYWGREAGESIPFFPPCLGGGPGILIFQKRLSITESQSGPYETMKHLDLLEPSSTWWCPYCAKHCLASLRRDRRGSRRHCKWWSIFCSDLNLALIAWMVLNILKVQMVRPFWGAGPEKFLEEILAAYPLIVQTSAAYQLIWRIS